MSLPGLQLLFPRDDRRVLLQGAVLDAAARAFQLIANVVDLPGTANADNAPIEVEVSELTGAQFDALMRIVHGRCVTNMNCRHDMVLLDALESCAFLLPTQEFGRAAVEALCDDIVALDITCQVPDADVPELLSAGFCSYMFRARDLAIGLNNDTVFVSSRSALRNNDMIFYHAVDADMRQRIQVHMDHVVNGVLMRAYAALRGLFPESPSLADEVSREARRLSDEIGRLDMARLDAIGHLATCEELPEEFRLSKIAHIVTARVGEQDPRYNWFMWTPLDLSENH